MACKLRIHWAIQVAGKISRTVTQIASLGSGLVEFVVVRHVERLRPAVLVRDRRSIGAVADLDDVTRPRQSVAQITLTRPWSLQLGRDSRPRPPRAVTSRRDRTVGRSNRYQAGRSGRYSTITMRCLHNHHFCVFICVRESL